MLSTTIYNQALNNIVDNIKSAGYHGDHYQEQKLLKSLIALMDYGDRHGLTLDSYGQDGKVRFRFKRCGYRPDKLYIEVEQETQRYKRESLTSHVYLNLVTEDGFCVEHAMLNVRHAKHEARRWSREMRHFGSKEHGWSIETRYI